MASASDNTELITAHSLREMGLAVLSKLGVPEADALDTIDSLIDADLRGVPSHGMRRLLWYAQRLQDRGTNPRPDLRLLAQTPGTALLDGDHGLGQVASKRAMEIAITKASTTGVGVVTVRNSHHFGACAYWAELALPHDMIGLCTTNGGVVMAPWGGTTPLLSNDPIGVAVPAGKELPIVLDVATSVVAGGKLDIAASKGENIPLGWALNSHGLPTTDPLEGRKGVLLPVGGHKGYGLTVIFEALAALISGARFGCDVISPSNTSRPMDIGHYFQAISVSAFSSVELFKSRVDALIRQLKSSTLAPGTDRIFLPGEKEFEARERHLKSGVPMPGEVLEQLRILTTRLGLSTK